MIISFDAAHSGLTKVLEGKIALDVECNPLQGEEVEKLVKALKMVRNIINIPMLKRSAFALDDTVESVTCKWRRI